MGSEMCIRDRFGIASQPLIVPAISKLIGFDGLPNVIVYAFPFEISDCVTVDIVVTVDNASKRASTPTTLVSPD